MPMTHHASEIAVLSGSSHPDLARNIAKHAGVDLSPIEISTFADGEISVLIQESVRGKHTFVVQSVSLHPNEYLVELLIIIDALRRASAQSVTAVIPYFGYSRQDRKDKPRVPITARLVADLLEKAGVQHLFTMDLHAPQVQGFFNIPVDDLPGRIALIDALKSMTDAPDVVVAPDIGSVKTARKYASALNCDFVIIDKQRQKNDDVEILNIIGSVTGKNVLLADDVCSTGSTLVSAAKACHEKGARSVNAVVTHGLFVGDAITTIEDSQLDWILTTDTIPQTSRLTGTAKIKTCSIAPQFGDAIRCSTSHESISSRNHR
ncbi:MAG: ribose-phosphate pyrophosphokinase [Parachlamydiales bacterium]|jgi:ribose-phosphate pyrophosphokinase